MKRRILGVSSAAVIGSLGAVTLLGWANAAEQRALAGQEAVEVLVVADEVPEGTPAAELAAYVTPELVPAKVRAEGAVGNLEELDGTVTAVDLVEGEQLVSTRFVSPEVFAQQDEVEIPNGLLQVTVSLDPQRAVGGQLRPGDTVGLVASFTQASAEGEEGQSTDGEETTHLILHKVLVANVQVEQLPVEETEGEGGGLDLAPTGNLLITLALDAPSVERVVFAAEHGTVWLTKQPTDAIEAGTRIQSKETIYR